MRWTPCVSGPRPWLAMSLGRWDMFTTWIITYYNYKYFLLLMHFPINNAFSYYIYIYILHICIYIYILCIYNIYIHIHILHIHIRGAIHIDFVSFHAAREILKRRFSFHSVRRRRGEEKKRDPTETCLVRNDSCNVRPPKIAKLVQINSVQLVYNSNNYGLWYL